MSIDVKIGGGQMLFYVFLSTLDAEERNCVEDIFDKYRNLIYKISFEILNNHHDAEDIVNDVMISVAKNVERFIDASGNDIIAQIVIFSRSASINLYKKNNRRSKIEMPFTYVNDEEELEEIDMEDLGESVDEIILTKEKVATVRKYLKLLPVELQDTIKLVYSLGYSNVEAARILHITPNAVGLRLFKAKKKLLKLSGGELNEDI